LPVCASLPAQNSGGIRGLVTDQSGAFVPGAHITATNEAGISTKVEAGADGNYAITGLAPGRYRVEVTATGLQLDQPLEVTVGSTIANLSVSLSVAMQKQEVTVSDTAVAQLSTDASSNASAIVVGQALLDSLSDDPDELQADLLALAGPGAGPNGGEIMIDGFVAGDAVLPSKSSIREIRINQNPFAPEYDAIGFGRTEILTKPGTDKLRGQVSVNYGNAALNTRNPYATEKPPFNLEDFAGNLGGSLGKRASFFFDGEERRILNGSVVDGATVIPGTGTNFIAVDPFTQNFSSTVQRQRISPRVDFQLSPKNTIVVRYGMTRTHTDEGGVGAFNLPSRAENTNLLEHAVQVVETALITNNVVDETRFQFLHQRQKVFADQPDAVSISASGIFNGGGATAPFTGYVHHHYDFTNTLMIASGKHAWKFGVRARGVQVYDETEQNFNGSYVFGGLYAPILDANNNEVVANVNCASVPPPAAGCATITGLEQYRRTLVFLAEGLTPAQITAMGGGATQLAIAFGVPRATVGQVDGAIFAGDDWRVLPNLTFSYGARYEEQSNVSDPRDIAPRLAFAWAPAGGSKNGRPSTVIRGGFGIFYDRFSEQNTLASYHYNGVNQTQYFQPTPAAFLGAAYVAGTVPTLGLPTKSQLMADGLVSAIHAVSPNIVASMIMQPAIGIEHQLPHNMTIATTYTMSHATHELLNRNVNAPIGYTGPGTGTYPLFPNTAPVYEVISGGLYNQHQIVTNVNARASAKINLFGYYVLNWVHSDTDATSGFGLNNTYPANQHSMQGEYGPASTDIRNQGTIGGTITTFWKLRLSPLITAASGAPFDIVTSQDIYGSNLPSGVYTARPGLLPAGSTKTGAIQTKYGLLDPNPTVNPVPGETLLPRNYGRGPGQFTVDLRIARTFSLVRERGSSKKGGGGDSGGGASGPAPSAGPSRRLGVGGFGNDLGTGGGGSGRNLILSIAGRNILNHLNQGPITGAIGSPLFGESNQIAGGIGAFSGSANNRRIELQALFTF
jgi:Carboxypeptidase regulatory-like domain